MQYASATEVQKNFSALLDAVQREPVVIRKQNLNIAAMLSMRDYERLCRVSREESQMSSDYLRGRFVTPKKLWSQMRKHAWIGSTKTRKKPLFDELGKEALCLFQRRSALFIGVTKRPHFIINPMV